VDLLDKQLEAGLEGNFERGWEIAQQLERERPNCNRAAFNRGWYMMQRNDLLKGFELMNRGRWEEVWGNTHIGTNKPIYDGRELNGEYILYTLEAGFGDEMVYVRFIKELSERGARIIVGCSKELKPLISRMSCVSAVVDYNVALSVYHDYWVPSMSAPYILGITYETLDSKPYLSADPESIDKFKLIINGDKPKIGIRWSGNPKFEHEQFRLFPEELMFDAVKMDGVKIYSLQKDWNKELPEHIIPLHNHLNTWEDTAGAIANLDMVISSCTSVPHLSAAMGKPTWIVTPVLSYYTWALPGSITPWYDSVTLFRQKIKGEWEDIFKEVKKELSVLI